MSSAPKRVLIVNDSATERALLWSIMRRDPMIQVVGEARDGNEARKMIKALSPDVITLDVEMPRKDGLTFLEDLMHSRPTPVVVISSGASVDSAATIRALTLGAVDCVDISTLGNQTAAGQTICRAIKAASAADVSRIFDQGATPYGAAKYRPSDKVVLVGASTGGVDAIFKLMSAYPENGPATVIAQHMPERFLAGLATGLDARFTPKVQLAEPMCPLAHGHVAVCPGGSVHTLLQPCDERPRLIAELDEGVLGPVPSIDRLFRSALPMADRVVAVLLSGVGQDGAQAMLELRDAGAVTIAQATESSVIDGMPRAAQTLGAASEVLPLRQIGRRIMELTTA